MASQTLDTLDTPCLVLERGRLQRNLQRMAQTVAGRGVRLRPHLKTAKCLEIAALATTGHSDPIAVSTLKEAEYFHTAGYRDIFYAVGLGPGKIERCARLLSAGSRLLTCVDNVVSAQAVAAAQALGVPFRTVIEIDCGEHRGGITPDDPALLTIARTLGAAFTGVTTHAGQSYGIRSDAARDDVSRVEANAARAATQRLADAGFPSAVISVGSTPTALTTADLHGITEVRAGVYMFGDLFQTGIGSCSLDDLAISVLTEVIGRPDNGAALLIDAGAFALSKDISTSALPPEKNAGYGWVCDVDGKLIPGLRVERVWQEHGLVTGLPAATLQHYPIGTRLRILPNHVCPTAAAHDRYHVVEAGRGVLADWPRLNGW